MSRRKKELDADYYYATRRAGKYQLATDMEDGRRVWVSLTTRQAESLRDALADMLAEERESLRITLRDKMWIPGIS